MHYTLQPIENSDQCADIIFKNAEEVKMIESYLHSSPIDNELLLYTIKNDWGYDEITFKQFVAIHERILETVHAFMFDALNDTLGEQLV